MAMAPGSWSDLPRKGPSMTTERGAFTTGMGILCSIGLKVIITVHSMRS